MMKQFLRERSGGKHPMLVANGRVVVTNTAAERLVNQEDESFVRHLAEEVMAGASVDVGEIVLTNGSARAVRCEPILDGSVVVGVVMHLEMEPAERIAPCWVSRVSRTPSARLRTSSPKV